MLLSKHMGGGGEPKFAEPYLTKLPHGLVEQLNSSRMVKPEQIKIASPQAYFYRRISRAAPLRGTYIKDSNERSEDSEKKKQHPTGFIPMNSEARPALHSFAKLQPLHELTTLKRVLI